MISETKLDESFPKGNFLIDGFCKPYRLDRDSNGGGIMLYVREDIPSNDISYEDKPIESFFVELNIQNTKILINCSYNPHKNDIKKHLAELRKSLDLHSLKYERILIMGDFNVEVHDVNMQSFRESYNLSSLIKQPTCYKNDEKPSCIDLILTNNASMFQSTCVIETGLSDFHLMTVTVMRKTFKKLRPRIINYRSYKFFSNDDFRVSLLNDLSDENLINNDNGLERFCTVATNTLNKFAPIKKKYARGNQMPFMTKELSKEIMTRSKLRNKYLKERTEENRLLFTQQRNKCVSLLRKNKKTYYDNLDVKNVTDNKMFWKTVKPYLSDKSIKSDKIHLNENGELIKSESETAEVLNNFFSNIVKNLKIPEFENRDLNAENIKDPVFRAILKYNKHPSIIAIKDKAKNAKFSFEEVDKEKIIKEIRKLNKNKASQDSDIPVSIMIDNADIFGDLIHQSVKNSLLTSHFPNFLKLGDITPLHKKGRKDDKGNYRPVSILPTLSKIFERIIFEQMSAFFDNFFSDQQCGFRKGYSAQHCLLNLLEKWKNSVDKGKSFGALLTDLSKAFDCLDHELLIAKLNAYGFSLPAIRLINDYLSNRKQRVKIDGNYSSWSDILFGVPQGSILGPLLFNIFMADLFFVMKDVDIASYADDTTPFIVENDIDKTITSLEEVSKTLFDWFKNNRLKSNADKCHALVSTNASVNIKIGDYIISNSKCEKLLGIKLDSNLNFNTHITDLCKKASRKVSALARVTPFMEIEKRKLLMNAFFTSQFSYCPLIWMCHSRENNRKINMLHERCLRIIYNDKQSSFMELLNKDNSVSIHMRNIQKLAIEMFKFRKGLSPPLMGNIFKLRTEIPYNLRNISEFSRPIVNSVYHGTESISYLGPKIWDILPQELKVIDNLAFFKKEIKKWKPENCPCRLCKIYIENLGFI